jgi:hypothetical protein
LLFPFRANGHLASFLEAKPHHLANSSVLTHSLFNTLCYLLHDSRVLVLQNRGKKRALLCASILDGVHTSAGEWMLQEFSSTIKQSTQVSSLFPSSTHHVLKTLPMTVTALPMTLPNTPLYKSPSIGSPLAHQFPLIINPSQFGTTATNSATTMPHAKLVPS